MEYPKGIEGDYVETKHTNLFFDVKGIHHPTDRKICFLRFYPDPKGDRIKKAQRFKKVYDLNERYSILRKKFPQYLFFSEQYDMELQGVKNEDIRAIYTPRDLFVSLNKKDNLTEIENDSRNLVEIFIIKGGISHTAIGITGSSMIQLNTDESDIDIIIYGTEISLEFQKKLKVIFEHQSNIRRYTFDEYREHYTWRMGGSNVQFEDFLRSEKRKLHQGIFQGNPFFIRYLKSPKDWKGTYYDYQYKNLGRIKLKAVVRDSKDSIFTPCSYKIECTKIMEEKGSLKNVNLSSITEVNSYRGRYCEQAKEGEEVLVEGKLEKVIFRNEVYFRILLTNQENDKMIVVNQ